MRPLSKKAKWSIALIAAVVLIGAGGLLYLRRLARDVRAAIELEKEIRAIGCILLLFVEDTGHPPRSMRELFGAGYLTVTDENRIAAGPASVGRFSRWEGPVRPDPFNHLDWIRIDFVSPESSGPVIRVVPDHGGERTAAMFSALIHFAAEDASTREERRREGQMPK